MESNQNAPVGAVPNPLDGLVSQDLYDTLDSLGLLRETGVRDYRMQREFWALRAEGVRPREAMEGLLDIYPYLTPDSIRKIVYRTNSARRIAAQP